MTAEQPMVRLTGVSKRFTKGKETISIFDHLDLAIPRGDFIAVMGPSGSGKTTLLNLLGGIDRADAGEIAVADQRIDGLSEGELAAWRAANIGFIFQFYNLMPMLTAAQNVELPLLLTKLNRKERAERGLDPLAPLLAAEPRQQQRQFDILRRGQHRHQIVELKDEADMGCAPARKFALGQAIEAFTGDLDPACIGPVDAAEQVEQRGLAGP